MYLKIEAGYRTYILRVTDIRNVSTGFSGKGWEIYIYYRCLIKTQMIGYTDL